MSYQDDLIAHLIAYKQKHLGGPPAGIFRHRGQDLSYEHILPARGSQLNFLDDSREEITSFLRSNPQVTLHKYFHHLNSSQAFALNLFVPFFTTKSDGTGLGLAHTQQIVNEHGGQINFATKRGEGSIFTIQLPLAVGG